MKKRLEQLMERVNTKDGHVLTREEKLALWISHIIPQTCVFLLENDTSVIKYHYDIDVSINHIYFELENYMEDLMKKYLQKPDGETFCLVIHNIDCMDEEDQYIFNGLVKDRYLCSNKLPKDIQIVFTINKTENRIKINHKLWHLGSNFLDF